MKAKVLKSFVCKETGKLQTEGSLVEYDEARITELATNGFVSKVDDKTNKSETKKPSGEA